MTFPPTAFSPSEAEGLSMAISDVLCWFEGFQAAHLGRESQPKLPPGLETMREINLRLKR